MNKRVTAHGGFNNGHLEDRLLVLPGSDNDTISKTQLDYGAEKTALPDVQLHGTIPDGENSGHINGVLKPRPIPMNREIRKPRIVPPPEGEQEWFDRQVVNERREAIIKSLEQRGVHIDTMPEGVCAGMPYVLPPILVKSGVTTYSEQHIRRMVRQGVIPGYRLAG